MRPTIVRFLAITYQVSWGSPEELRAGIEPGSAPPRPAARTQKGQADRPPAQGPPRALARCRRRTAQGRCRQATNPAATNQPRATGRQGRNGRQRAGQAPQREADAHAGPTANTGAAAHPAADREGHSPHNAQPSAQRARSPPAPPWIHESQGAGSKTDGQRALTGRHGAQARGQCGRAGRQFSACADEKRPSAATRPRAARTHAEECGRETTTDTGHLSSKGGGHHGQKVGAS